MTKDEERRRVANALREPSSPLDLHASIYDALYMRPEVVETTIPYQFTVYNNLRLLNRLADLIDRPAARNVAPAPSGHEPRAFTCELCGEWQPMDFGFARCPNCGAEVVSDGDD